MWPIECHIIGTVPADLTDEAIRTAQRDARAGHPAWFMSRGMSADPWELQAAGDAAEQALYHKTIHKEG